MASDDNVVKMPTELTRLFADARRAVAMGTESKQKFIEGKLLLMASLAAIRAKFPDNETFGKSCAEHGLGENVVSKDDRSILIQWAERPEWTRTVLEKTERTSVQTIHRNEWLDSLRSPTKSPVNQKSPQVGGSKTKSVHAALQANEATGTKASHKEVARALGVSESTVTEAARDLKAARTAELGQIYYTKAQDHHVEMKLKILDKEREKSFEARVTAENKRQIDILFPQLEEIQNAAKRNEKYYREQIERHAIFTEAEYRDLLFCTHEANPSKETRERAFIALNAKKLQLTGKL
jgi:hypothetical protein